ncbi:hypothetical protein KFL_001720010 [Klebsormidium nitens]|uniref:Auxin efflux carrier family protein n=1 Tax=Klebsormidium nitens TaxID=105231 RepID=A0A0U9HSH1_KLENI|nr:hypothetical protein KFL_001720010 [Klebsormidium nitens]|eukprot:GAQ83988.1 hypothetical protein KFL_001720010 [Klebsormidium nitens]
MPAGAPSRSFPLQTALESRPWGSTSSFAVFSDLSLQGLGSPSSAAVNSFRQLGSLGSVAGPVHIVSQRSRSSRLANPVFLEHPRALGRKGRQRKVAVASLPAANQALNQGVSQALSEGGLNQFAELAVGAAKKAFNVGVLGATAGASLKLFTVCALVVWMQKSGRLPESTPAVLSQVAFRLLIPCFLMSKVAVTLYSDFSPALLAVPVAAIVQILLGAGMGRLAAHFAYREPPLVPAHFEAHQPTRASSLVAASVAIATGQPDVAVALTAPKGVGAAKLGASKEALMTATSAFGNSLTLPLVFLSALLDRAGADKAAGYLALYMVGWSPALWTFGYKIIAGSSDDPENGDESDYEGEGRWQAFLTWLGRVMNPPLYGVFLGLIIGATPLAHLFLPPATAAAENLANATSITPLTVLATLTSGVFRPVMEAASLLGTATLAVQTVVLASSLAASIPSRLHSFSGGAQPFVATPGANPNPLTDALREGEGPVDSVVSESSSLKPRRRKTGRLKPGPDPANVLDGRAVWVVSGVRLLLLPLVNLFLTLGLMRAHILPADPICGLVLMAEAAMPSAQNLVLLAQLKAKTRPLAGMVAGLLLRQYALSILPITFWMAIFLSVLGLATLQPEGSPPGRLLKAASESLHWQPEPLQAVCSQRANNRMRGKHPAILNKVKLNLGPANCTATSLQTAPRLRRRASRDWSRKNGKASV